MTEYYPVYLNLSGKRCVIVGGGAVAQGKIAALRQSGATITLISPDATPGIQKAALMGDIEWQVRKYQLGDLTGAFIAVAATNVWHINREIYEEADRLGVLLNVVDDPDLCTFIAPSIVKKGPVTLAISTGGASPALARKLRETLANDENLKWADLAVVLGQARKLIKEQRTVVDPERWQCCITEELLQMTQNGQEEEALAKLLSRLLDQNQPDLCLNLDECSSQGCLARPKNKVKEMVG